MKNLRSQNEEVRKENENLKAQIYGTTSSSSNFLPLNIPDYKPIYPLSPLISGAFSSGTSRTSYSPPTSGPSLGFGLAMGDILQSVEAESPQIPHQS